jgi:hypothetical protein
MNSVFYTSSRFVDQSIATDISALQFCFSLSYNFFIPFIHYGSSLWPSLLTALY